MRAQEAYMRKAYLSRWIVQILSGIPHPFQHHAQLIAVPQQRAEAAQQRRRAASLDDQAVGHDEQAGLAQDERVHVRVADVMQDRAVGLGAEVIDLGASE